MNRAFISIQPRHPELVSGSIVPLAQRSVSKVNGTVLLLNNTPVCAEKWTLKQVQGDDVRFGR